MTRTFLITAGARFQLHECAINVVKNERHQLNHSHQEHVPILRMANFMGHNRLHFGFIEEIKEPPGNNYAGIIRCMTVGKSVGSTVIDNAKSWDVHVFLFTDLLHKSMQMYGESVKRDPLHFVKPVQ